MSDIKALPTVDMQRLRLAISSDPQDYSPSRDDYLFKRIPVYGEVDASFKDGELYLRVEKVIHETSHSTVFLSKINDFSVVVKCCDEGKFFDDFRKEANVYQRYLRDLQGFVVPRFFGYYEELDEEYGPFSCLILEYCGTTVHDIFERLEPSEK